MKISERIERQYVKVLYLTGVLYGVHRPPNFRLTLTHYYPFSQAILEAYHARNPGAFDKEELGDILAATRKMYDEGI